MDLEYNILNILILFGAIQGFILCAFLYKKRRLNIKAVDFFVLFLFSLSFYNLIYAALDMELFQYNRALHMFPFPYKWLIGLGFYFYIKNHFPPSNSKPYHQKEWYLFIPAIIYLGLRTYWFSIAVAEDSFRITRVVVDSNFFRIHEFFYLLFTIVLLIECLRILQKHRALGQQPHKAKQSFNWYRRLTVVFLSIIVINLLVYGADLIVHGGIESSAYTYPVLLINVFLIYWIGIMGFSKPTLFFYPFVVQQENFTEEEKKRDKQIHETMVSNELFLNPKLDLHTLATHVGIPPKELSKHINRMHRMNISEFVNTFRIDKVKMLLSSSEAEKYTILTLAESSGFNSKSSFNAAFKKATGMTPSAYRKTVLETK